MLSSMVSVPSVDRPPYAIGFRLATRRATILRAAPGQQDGAAGVDFGHARSIIRMTVRCRCGSPAERREPLIRDEETLLTDGPYAELKEQLGGCYLLFILERLRQSAILAGLPPRRDEHGPA